MANFIHGQVFAICQKTELEVKTIVCQRLEKSLKGNYAQIFEICQKIQI